MLSKAILLATIVNGEAIPAAWNLAPKMLPKMPLSNGELRKQDCKTESCSSASSLPGRQKQSINYNSCMQATLTVQNQDFSVQVCPCLLKARL